MQKHVDLLTLAAETTPGTAVPIEYIREGRTQRASVRVAAPDDDRPRPVDAGGTDRLGFRLAPLPEAQARRMGLEGALVVQRAAGPARRAGLFPGDIVLSMNGRPVRTLEGFRASLEKARSGDAVALLVERSGNRAFVPLRMP